ncbi:DUF5710 domain-containing protein [Undibacterium arcticum]|uniref:DUF5710 domain-containing protein n=1 Tax=Undibacterium arcticum TaxID=1762892 RepID=UPI00360D828E
MPAWRMPLLLLSLVQVDHAAVPIGRPGRVRYADRVTEIFKNMMMNKAPPFDPPYITTTDTIDGARAVETLADGTERVVTAQAIIHGRAVSSRPATPARKAVNPVVHGNAESILFLDVPFAEKDSVKRLGARWDGAMRKWYIPTAWMCTCSAAGGPRRCNYRCSRLVSFELTDAPAPG